MTCISPKGQDSADSKKKKLWITVVIWPSCAVLNKLCKYTPWDHISSINEDETSKVNISCADLFSSNNNNNFDVYSA